MDNISTFTVWFRNPSNHEHIEKRVLSGPDNKAVKVLATRMTAVDLHGVFEFDVYKVRKNYQRNGSSPKQTLHMLYIRAYGPCFIVDKVLEQVDKQLPEHMNDKQHKTFLKFERDKNLVKQQVAKLKRDVQDLFRNLGVKIK